MKMRSSANSWNQPAGCRPGTRLLILLTSIVAISLGSLGYAAEPADTTLPADLGRIYRDGEAPVSLDELRQMDLYQQALVQQISQVTVALQIGPTRGSGVLVSKEGYVLTAAHVAGRAGLEVRVIMPDGQKYRGTTLGMNKGVDAALLKIEPQFRDGEPVEWPFANMGHATDLKPGSWCLAMGHPGGYQENRQPVARFGRVLTVNGSVIRTDCKLIGGDSGGPLFDMEGNVIGVHSRIGSKVTKNLHVPVDNYRDDWPRLVRGDSWGSLLDVVGRPVIGVLGHEEMPEARIAEVLPASPAERAGVRPGDLVTRFGTKRVESFDDLKRFVGQRQPGDEVTLEVLRGDQKLELKIVLAAMARS